MNLETLCLVCDVARLRSFSQGARENGVSQSAASQAVHLLEHELGVALLDRSKRPVALTAEGEVYVQGCRRILDEHRRLAARVRGPGVPISGIVRVAAIYSAGFLNMGRRLQAFRTMFPKTRIRVDYLRPDRVLEAVESGEADLGILSYPKKSRTIRVLPLRLEPMALASLLCAPLARRRRLQPEDLQGVPFIAFDRDLPIRKAVDRWLRARRIRVRVDMEFDNIETIKQAILAGQGVSILPEAAFEREVRERLLVAIPLPPPAGLARPIGIIHRANRRPSPTAERFIGVLREGGVSGGG